MPGKFVAPDGGWGWVVVAAYATTCIIVIPTLQGFALLYRNVFIDLDMTATDINTIINVNSAFGLILGLFSGPLLKTFGFRAVAMVGSLFIFTGFALCSRAYSFTEFIIYYGIINSMGFSTTLSAYGLALNTYFIRRRNLASGLCTAITGLGPVVMPFLMSFLLDTYAVRGTALIFSGLILHSFVGALLLHPVAWHTKNENGDEKELKLLEPEVNVTRVSIGMKESHIEEEESNEEEDCDSRSVYGLENSVIIPTKTTENGGQYASKMSLNEKSTISPDPTWWRRTSNAAPRLSISSSRIEQPKKKKSKWLTKIVELFDFDLLKDAGYRNIWLGLSLAFTGEINFSLMTPLILGDKGMSIDETAHLMSSIATTDIIFRFLSPFIGDWLKWSPKYMYMSSLICLVLTRTTLTLVSGYYQILGSCLLIGVAKGLRTVYMVLVIPSYVPLEKLASACGLQTLLNGLLLIFVGPGLGYLRDTVGNYNVCIHVINMFSTVTIILWSVELFLSLRKSKSTKKDEGPPET